MTFDVQYEARNVHVSLAITSVTCPSAAAADNLPLDDVTLDSIISWEAVSAKVEERLAVNTMPCKGGFATPDSRTVILCIRVKLMVKLKTAGRHEVYIGPMYVKGWFPRQDLPSIRESDWAEGFAPASNLDEFASLSSLGEMEQAFRKYGRLTANPDKETYFLIPQKGALRRSGDAEVSSHLAESTNATDSEPPSSGLATTGSISAAASSSVEGSTETAPKPYGPAFLATLSTPGRRNVGTGF